MNCLLSGTISVKAALETGVFTPLILYVNPKKRSRDIAYLIAIAKQQKVTVEFSDAAAMNAMAAGNGGVILYAAAMPLPSLESAPPLQGLCVYVSGVEDPYNLGSIARTLYAAGASCMILHARDWSHVLSVLMRSSAGAWARLPIFTVDCEEELLARAEADGLRLVCASRDAQASSLFESSMPSDCLMAIGGAMRGLSSLVLHAPGDHFYIPYGREFRNALDSVSAAAVFAFAWTRQNAAPAA